MKVRVTGRKKLYHGHFRLDRYRFRHTLYAGGWSKSIKREVFDRGNAVGVLLYDPTRDAVVLTEQFRLPAHVAGASGWQIETVAGMLDHAGESEKSLARREAKEEAGVTVAGELIPMHRILLSPGGSTERLALYCAQVDSTEAGGIFGLAEEGEDIKVLVMKFSAAMRMLRANKIENATAAIALYWLADNRNRLRKRWRKND